MQCFGFKRCLEDQKLGNLCTSKSQPSWKLRPMYLLVSSEELISSSNKTLQLLRLISRDTLQWLGMLVSKTRTITLVMPSKKSMQQLASII